MNMDMEAMRLLRESEKQRLSELEAQRLADLEMMAKAVIAVSLATLVLSAAWLVTAFLI